MAKSPIKEVVYRVCGAFGASDEGDLMRAYKIADAVDDGIVLLFHPKDKGGSGSLEFGIISKDTQLTKAKIFEPQSKHSEQGEEIYINLPPTQEKFYRALVAEAGFEIPKNLLLQAAPPSDPKPARRPRR